ncbi:MAG TPA: hypothetical protein VEZ89_14605 [Rubrivivax sp.]|nr:hypothetical protein [Rubrivivax sp.]
MPERRSTARIGGVTAAGIGCTLLTLFSGALCCSWLAATGSPSLWPEALICGAPAAVTAALACTSQTDRNQYVVRLMAAAAMLPVLLMMWASSQETAAGAWPLALAVFGLMAMHVVGFAILVWHLAWLTTRLEADPAARVPAALLEQRLQDLLADSAEWRLARGEAAGEWLIDSTQAGAGRFHRVLLNIDQTRCEVQVRERESVSGAAPRNASEASMRTVGDQRVDAARPDAQRIWSRRLMATIVVPERVAATHCTSKPAMPSWPAASAPGRTACCTCWLR